MSKIEWTDQEQIEMDLDLVRQAQAVRDSEFLDDMEYRLTNEKRTLTPRQREVVEEIANEW